MTLADDVTLDELIMAKDDLSGADIKVCTSPLFIVQNLNPQFNCIQTYMESCGTIQDIVKHAKQSSI